MAGQTKKRASKTALTGEVVPVLDSAKVMSLRCEAFSDPNKTSGGVLAASGNIRLRLQKDEEGNLDPRVLFEFVVQANTEQENLEGEETQNNGKVFEARCTMEGAYTYPDGFKMEKEAFTDGVVHNMMLQLHPLVVSKVNQMMIEMGFTAAYVSLGVTPLRIGRRVVQKDS